MDNQQLSNLVHALLQDSGETEWVEFKHNNTSPQEIGQYLSALANAACLSGERFGYLVWGIHDKSHEPVGTTFRPREAKHGNQELQLWLSLKLSPRPDFRFFETTVQGAAVVILQVDAARDQPIRFEGQAYIRVGTSKTLLRNHPEKERKIWTTATPIHVELGVAATDLSEKNVFELLNIPVYYDLSKTPLPENRQQMLKDMLDLQVLSAQGERFSITNLGGLLLARDLRRFPTLRFKAIRVMVYQGTNKLEPEREIPERRGYALMFEDLIKLIDGLLPQNELLEGALREEVKVYPRQAVRELVGNALLHQDLTKTGSAPMVEVYSDRLEVTSSGIPITNPARFLDEPSRSRNENLAFLAREMRMCEERGSGIDRVVFSAEVYQLPPPSFDVVEEHVVARLFAPRSFAEMTAVERIRACYQHASLKAVSNDAMTNQSLRERFGIAAHNAAQVTRVINAALEAGWIKPYDPSNQSNRYARYVPYWAVPASLI